MEVQAEKTSRNKPFDYHWQTKAALKPISDANQAGYGQLHPTQTPVHAFVSGSSLASPSLLPKRIKKFSQRTSEIIKRQTWHDTHRAGRVPQEGGGVSPARVPLSAPRRRGRLRSTVPVPRRSLAPAPRGTAGSASGRARGCLHRPEPCHGAELISATRLKRKKGWQTWRTKPGPSHHQLLVEEMPSLYPARSAMPAPPGSLTSSLDQPRPVRLRGKRCLTKGEAGALRSLRELRGDAGEQAAGTGPGPREADPTARLEELFQAC